MQGQQAGIRCQYMAVAIQAFRGTGHAGTCPLICPGVATLTLHGRTMRCRVRGMAERYTLRGTHRTRRIRVAIYQHHGKHPRCTKKAEGVHKNA